MDRQKALRDAEKLVSRGKYDAAIKKYRQVLDASPRDTNTLNRVGDLYVRTKRLDDAIELFHRAAQHFTDEGFFVKAIAIYKKILRLDPGQLDIYEKLADLYHRQGLSSEARVQYEVVADYHLKHGDLDAAIDAHRKIIEVVPDDASHHLKLAELYQEAGRSEDALSQYHRIADLMLEDEKVGEALKVYRSALEVDASDLEFVKRAVHRLKDAGQRGAARELMAFAVERNAAAAELKIIDDRRGGAEAEAEAAAVGESEDVEATAEAAAPAEEEEVEPPQAAADGEASPEEVAREEGAEEDAVEAEAEVYVLDDAEAVSEDEYEISLPPVDVDGEAAEESLELAAVEAAESVEVEDVASAPAEAEEIEAEAVDEVIEIDLDELVDTEQLMAEIEVVIEPEAEPDLEVVEAAAEPVDEEVEAGAETPAEASVEGLAEVREEAETDADGEEIGVVEATAEEATAEEDTAEAASKEEDLSEEVSAEPDGDEASPEPAVAEVAAEAETETESAAEPVSPDDLLPAAADAERPVAEVAAPFEGPEEIDLVAEATVLASYGLYGKAIDRLHELLSSEPDRLDVRERLVRVYIEQGSMERAATEATDLAHRCFDADAENVWANLRSTLREAGFRVERGEVQPPMTEPAPAADEPPTAEAAGLGPPEVTPVVPDAAAALGFEGPVLPGSVEAHPAGIPEDGTAVAEDWLGVGGPDVAPPEVVAADDLFAEEDEFFDLAAELEEELDRDGGLPEGELIPDIQEQSLDEIVEGFRKGVAEALSEEDFDTHYNLGIAYREMGLLDEAIGEFQLAAKDPRYLVDCCSLLAACFLDKGFPELAIKWYERGLESPAITEEESLGLRYELGSLYHRLGDRELAYEQYVEIYGANSNYRDVVAKLEELRNPPDAG